jgi:hypothetical protein
MKCPDKIAWSVRKPEFLEQLIPPILKNHHSIHTKTPIHSPNKLPIQSPYDAVVEIPEDKDGKFIRATLASYNLQSSGKIENKRVLEAYVSLIGKKVVYLQNEKDTVEKQAKNETKHEKPEKKIIKFKKSK